MENNYWIVNDWLIFKPYFNFEITNYYDIINKHNKIMFSNHNEPLIALKKNNIYEFGIFKYNFNQAINLSNNINLIHLTFGWNFNQEINLLNNINLTHLTFGENFNQEIDLSNNINLTHLTFGRNFNKKIDISLNVKSLAMCCCNNQYIIDNLHNNIEELNIYGTNLNLDNLPNSIKNIKIHYYNKKLNNLPNSIEYLELGRYNLKIKKIPKNLKTIKCNTEYEYIDDFKDYKVIYF